MTEAEIAEIAAWLAKAGLKGLAETKVLAGFCERAVSVGLPLSRASVFIDTLHPIHEGRLFRWESDQPKATSLEYGRATEEAAVERWRRSPFYWLLESGELLLRRRITSESEAEFSLFPELRAAGITDYVAMINRFSDDGVIGDMDCVYSSWLTSRAGGFSDAEIATLRHLMPFLGLAVKSASLQQIAETLVHTYLGRDAGQRVLSGSIQRGVADKIEAVLWFSDLRNFTRIADTSPPEQIIPLLNDYADAVVSSINKNNGDVLEIDSRWRPCNFPGE